MRGKHVVGIEAEEIQRYAASRKVGSEEKRIW